MNRLILIVILLAANGCESTYYDALEQVGYHKRDIMIDRIESAQEAQQEGQQQFKNALEQLRMVLEFDGGDLGVVYDKLNDEYDDSVAAAETISDRIDSVASVSEALFSEWEAELTEYSSRSLRRSSEKQLAQTRRQYNKLMNSMRRAESSIDPVLASLKDNVLYLKHNLNARAISSIRGELGNVNQDVRTLLDAMQIAIDDSDAFIAQLRE